MFWCQPFLLFWLFDFSKNEIMRFNSSTYFLVQSPQNQFRLFSITIHFKTNCF